MLPYPRECALEMTPTSLAFGSPQTNVLVVMGDQFLPLVL